MTERRTTWIPKNGLLSGLTAALMLAAVTASGTGALATSESDVDALTRAAATRLAFAAKLQGRWSCRGATAGGIKRTATILLFTVKPTVYEFELTPVPASSTWSNVVETWKWVWSYGTQGRWFATADARTEGAGIQFVSDGWSGASLVWKQYVLPSTISRTFELLPDGGLTFSVHDRSGSGDSPGDYRLTCRRAAAR